MILLALGGCLSLDYLFYGGDGADVFELDPGIVPPELVELQSFTTADGLVLQGVWAHQPDPAADVLVYFHGKSANLPEHWTNRVEPLWALGYAVFAFDYRGYGVSEGTQDGAQILEEDGLAAVEHVLATTGRAPEEVYWYALSLGGAVALHTSDEVGARAIVIESVFASTDYMIDGTLQLDLPTAWFVETPADNVEAIRSASAPLLIVHGLADDFVDPDSALLLFDAAPDPRELWRPEGVGHSTLAEDRPVEFAERVRGFYDRW